MPIAMESGRRGHGGDLFGRGGALCPAAACGGPSSAGWGSDSRVGMVHCEDAEESDGEVQSSYRGPLDTMDALQQVLPRSRRGLGTKFDNSKSSSLVSTEDAVFLQHTKDPANPEDPSPKKRKGLLSCSVDQNKSQSKELNPVDDATNSPSSCRKLLYPAITDSCPVKNRGYNEHGCCKNLPCYCLQRSLTVDAFDSPPTALLPELTSVQKKFVAISLNDVTELTDVIFPSEKRRKN
ncbi:hypothetical protein E2562_018062 [Oryza meyeriana var. granulata]|uniref:Uncharacterized protein n=1 Tax=Oryza meyeriana var. granulata TaxID=110450 RepID=A0A6G1CR06_9ORYZ|nr:hypothetical protein E2562_018062 [Oryza meyeriana var. granulata]